MSNNTEIEKLLFAWIDLLFAWIDLQRELNENFHKRLNQLTERIIKLEDRSFTPV